MARLLLPDGTEVQATPEQEANPPPGAQVIPDSTVPGATPTQPSAFDGPGFLEDPLASIGSAARGLVRAVPGGTAFNRNLDELTTQLTDSNDSYNYIHDAEDQHRVAGVVGTIGGIGAQAALSGGATLGFSGVRGALAANVFEAGVYGAADGFANQYTEDALENPGMASELMAANALRASLVEGAQTAVTAGVLGGALYGAGRAAGVAADYASAGVNRIRAAANGVSDEAMEIAIRELDDSRGLAGAARAVDANPLSPMAQAVRRVREEGAEAFVQRTRGEVADIASRAVADLSSVRVPRGVLMNNLPEAASDMQRMAMGSAYDGVAPVHAAANAISETLGNAVDAESAALLNVLRNKQAITGLDANAWSGRQLGDMYADMVDGVNELRARMPRNSPEMQSLLEPALARMNSYVTDEATFGKAASALREERSAANALLNYEQALAGGGNIPSQTVEAARLASDYFSNIASAPAAGSVGRRAGRVDAINAARRAQISASAQEFRNGIDRMAMSDRVVRLSDEVEKIKASPNILHSLGRWSSRGVGYAVGGFPGAFAADQMYRVTREAGAARNAIWAAQKAYDDFTGKASEALFSYVRRPRPAGVRIEFNSAQYDEAVNAVKRSAGIPVPTASQEASTVAPRGKRSPVAAAAAARPPAPGAPINPPSRSSPKYIRYLRGGEQRPSNLVRSEAESVADLFPKHSISQSGVSVRNTVSYPKELQSIVDSAARSRRSIR